MKCTVLNRNGLTDMENKLMVAGGVDSGRAGGEIN